MAPQCPGLATGPFSGFPRQVTRGCPSEPGNALQVPTGSPPDSNCSMGTLSGDPAPQGQQTTSKRLPCLGVSLGEGLWLPQR